MDWQEMVAHVVGVLSGLGGGAAGLRWYQQSRRDAGQDANTRAVLEALAKLEATFSRELQLLRGDVSLMGERIKHQGDSLAALEARVNGQGEFNQKQFASLRRADDALRQRVAVVEASIGVRTPAMGASSGDVD
jgi:hypothetical protein